MGPTILIMPSVLARIFAEAGRDLATTRPGALDPQWRCSSTTARPSTSHADVERWPEPRRASPRARAGRRYRRFLDLSGTLQPHLRALLLLALGRLARRHVRLEDVVQAGIVGRRDRDAPWAARSPATVRSFVPEPRVAQMLDHFTQYVGSAPDHRPRCSAGIAAYADRRGRVVSEGGHAGRARALAHLARTGRRVPHGTRRPAIERDAAGGVAGVDDRRRRAHRLAAVVSNADSVRTHRELLAGRGRGAFDAAGGYEPACSGVVLYLGLDRRYEHLLHHNFVFSRDPHEEFDTIYRKGEPAPDPTCYVCRAGRDRAGGRPARRRGALRLVHTPYLRPLTTGRRCCRRIAG